MFVKKVEEDTTTEEDETNKGEASHVPSNPVWPARVFITALLEIVNVVTECESPLPAGARNTSQP